MQKIKSCKSGKSYVEHAACELFLYSPIFQKQLSHLREIIKVCNGRKEIHTLRRLCYSQTGERAQNHLLKILPNSLKILKQMNEF